MWAKQEVRSKKRELLRNFGRLAAGRPRHKAKEAISHTIQAEAILGYGFHACLTLAKREFGTGAREAEEQSGKAGPGPDLLYDHKI